MAISFSKCRSSLRLPNSGVKQDGGSHAEACKQQGRRARVIAEQNKNRAGRSTYWLLE